MIFTSHIPSGSLPNEQCRITVILDFDQDFCMCIAIVTDRHIIIDGIEYRWWETWVLPSVDNCQHSSPENPGSGVCKTNVCGPRVWRSCALYCLVCLCVLIQFVVHLLICVVVAVVWHNGLPCVCVCVCMCVLICHHYVYLLSFNPCDFVFSSDAEMSFVAVQ